MNHDLRYALIMLAALAALLPDEAERVSTEGGIEVVGLDALRTGDVVLPI